MPVTPRVKPRGSRLDGVSLLRAQAGDTTAQGHNQSDQQQLGRENREITHVHCPQHIVQKGEDRCVDHARDAPGHEAADQATA